ncbi:TonB-dependent receptor [Compostibacter hankyongensis]|uniref:TonB-dependent receptor n=1 Tax=Compostibacter hankyongensis TaxID=1007089 RepID=A0ABP8FD38_9BACT
MADRSCFGQQLRGTLSASLVDSATGVPLSAATVLLETLQDSSVEQSALAGEKGDFRLTHIPEGPYRLLVTHLGYRSFDTTLVFDSRQPEHDLGRLLLVAGAVLLDPVTIEELQPPVSMNGDTMQFSAGAFKTHENAVVEDLLKKLPGMDVDDDGNITAQGEQVVEVLVDGKPFFGNDPKITTQNLPVDMIDQVQVFDKTSDQAAFTGIHDGNTRKTINLIIKKDRRRGTFGRATAGYGSEDRYQLNGMVNRFDNDQRISLLGGANNINRQGFSRRDGGGNGGSGGGGITNSQMGGLNYRDSWGPKLEVNGSYFVSHTRTRTEQKSSRQNILPDSSFFSDQQSTSTNEALSHRFNMNFEYTIDSTSALIFRPTLSYTTSDNSASNIHASRSDKQVPINEGIRNNSAHSTSPDFDGSLLYRKKLKKKGRTFSIGLSGGYNGNDGLRYNKSEDRFHTGADSSALLDQQNDNHADSYHWEGRLSYTEPLYTDHYLELEYSYSRNNSNSDRRTYNFNPGTKRYDDYDSLYSNAFRNSFIRNRGSLNFIANKEKYDYTVGLSLQDNRLSNDWLMSDSTLTQHTLNLYPLFNFHYNFSRTRRLRLEYRGNTRPPSISELQPVPDNSNSLRIRLGNPDLKTAFTNNVRLSYNSFSPQTYRNLQASLNFTTVSNQIVSSSYYDEQRRQYIQPVNVNGTYNLNGDVSFSLPWEKIGLKIDPATTIRYTHDVGFVNREKNLSRNLSLGQRLRLTYDIDELLDLNVNGRINYNKATYSLLPDRNQSFFNYGLSFDFELRLPAGFLVGSDVRYSANSGLAAGYNRTTTLLNAYIAKQCFKKKQGTFRLQGFDLLNQRRDIRRRLGATYIEDSESMGLARYFMLSFTYNFNRFGGRRGMGGRGGGFRGNNGFRHEGGGGFRGR